MDHSLSLSNLARFDLVSIRLAVYCQETGSLSSAARRANMSLSRASQRLTALETALGKRLFKRHCQGLAPTPEGLLLATYGRSLLKTVESLSRELVRGAAADSDNHLVR